MEITRISPITGQQRTIDLPISQEQMDDWMLGTAIQLAMPNLSPNQREFIKTGIYPGEFEEKEETQSEEELPDNFEVASFEFIMNDEKHSFEVVTNLSTFGIHVRTALDNWLARTETFTIEDFCEYVMSKDPQIICVTKEYYDSLPEDEK